MPDKNHSARTLRLRRGAAVFLPVLAGLLAMYVLAQGRQAPARKPDTETAKPVSVIPVPSLDVIPTALGYGIAQPGDVWRAVAEVPGRIVEKHSELDEGSILSAGTVILRIDPRDFELRVKELEAGLRARQAQLRALTTRQRNTRRSLEIERRSLRFAEAELERQEDLLKKGAIPASQLDRQQRTVLQQERTVQTLENELAMMPDEQAQLEAEIEREQARLDQARRDVHDTLIDLPFDARISQVNVELSQFVSPGELLAAADSIALTEVSAQIPVDRFRNLLAPGVPMPPLDSDAVQQFLGDQSLSAVVRLRTGASAASWDARVDRLSGGLDPQTRTVGVVVAVDEPYARARPPEHPPLVKNMYVQVELRGKARPNTLIIPRSALHGTEAYIVGHDRRLDIRPVKVAFAQSDFVAISDGLRAGELVLIADLVPAIEGTLLDPMVDKATVRSLKAQAQGASP